MLPDELSDYEAFAEGFDEDEKEALWLLVTGHTRERVAEIFEKERSYTRSKSQKTIDRVKEKLAASTLNGASSKALLLRIVSPEEAARHYGIPTSIFTGERWLRSVVDGTYGDLPLVSPADINNPDTVNQWLSEKVVTRMRKRPKWDAKKFNAAFSHILMRARTCSPPYAPHSLASNTQMVHPVDAFYASLSLEFLIAYLIESNQIAGPWLCSIGNVPIVTLPYAISEEIAEPILDRGDAAADLAREILEYRKQVNEGFRQLIKKWHCLFILPKSAIVELVTNYRKAKDDWLQNLGAHALTDYQVEDWLQNLIKFLVCYDKTFHVALLDDINNPHHVLVKFIKSAFLSIKLNGNGQNTLFWEEWEPDPERRWREKDRMVIDMSVITALIGILGYCWQALSEDVLIRDREAVIQYLKDQCNSLPCNQRKDW